jgi:uncharacterized membrane protein
VFAIIALVIWLKPEPVPAVGTQVGESSGYENVRAVMAQRCYMCHGEQVQMKNVRLDTPQNLKDHAQNVYLQVVVTRLMPLNNATHITEAERLVVKRWFEAGATTQ